MLRLYSSKLHSLVITLVMTWAVYAGADVTFNGPDVAGVRIPYVHDYATEVLGNPWDMDSRSDLAEYIQIADYYGFSDFDFSGGVFSTGITADNAYFHLLSPGQCSTNPLGKNGQSLPIDTTKYRYLSIRMYTDHASEIRVLVNTGCSYATDYWMSVGVATVPGWQTYTVDLQTIVHQFSSGQNVAWNVVPATGLRINPSLAIGGVIKIDWITLTAEDAYAGYTVDYAVSPGASDTHVSVFLDDDTTPLNGYRNVLLNSAAAHTPIVIRHGHTPIPVGSYYLTAVQSDDFASLQGNPWDMSESSDVGSSAGVSASVSAGTFSGTTTSVIPTVELNNFDGASMNTAIFRYLSLSFSVSQAGSAALQWFDVNGNYMGQYSFALSVGSHVYQIDMHGRTGWSGDIGRCRLKLHNTSGVTFLLNWVALRSSSFVASEPAPAVFSSPGELYVNDPPRLQILQPDNKGGADFAATVLGNPWNMDDVGDIKSVFNITTPLILPDNAVAGVGGDFFKATSTEGSADPYQASLESKVPAEYIDATRFRNLSFGMLIDRPQDVANGSVARVIWRTDGETTPAYYNGDDTMLFEGWSDYVQDMTAIKLEPAMHAPGSYLTPIWHGMIPYFRIDAHEFTPATDFYFDYIRLAADDEANSRFAITYDLSDRNDQASDVQLSLYYTTSPTTIPGTLIVSGLTLASPTRVYLWDTSNIPDGSYYIYAEANDGLDTTQRVSSGRITISHTRAQDLSAPVLDLERPVGGQTIYDDLTLRGFALDDIQTALVEVLIDHLLIGTIRPALFHTGAHAAYSRYVEGSNAGFFSTFDVRSLALGRHTLEVRTWDTAGNQTTTGPMSVTKGAGRDPSPESSPAFGNAAPIAIDIEPPIPTLLLKARLGTASRLVSFTVDGGRACKKVSLFAANTKADFKSNTNVIQLGSKAGAAHISLSASKMRGLQRKKFDITLYFAATCNGVIKSKVVSLIPTRLRVSPIKTPQRWITYLKRRLQ